MKINTNNSSHRPVGFLTAKLADLAGFERIFKNRWLMGFWGGLGSKPLIVAPPISTSMAMALPFNPLHSKGRFSGPFNLSVGYVHSCLELVILIKISSS